jgi:hypothetical protein
MRRTTIIVLILLAALVSFGVARGSDQPGEPVFASGQATPTTFGVAGPNGEPLICANGKELRVPAASVLGPPKLNPTAAAKQGLLAPKRGEEKFWRCGTGATPHLNARLVPASEDPLNANPGTTP